MCKHCSNVCELHLCLATESTNLARMRTIMTAALQWQHLQREFIFWIALVYGYVRLAHSSMLTVCDNAGRIKEIDLVRKGSVRVARIPQSVRMDCTKNVRCGSYIFIAT